MQQKRTEGYIEATESFGIVTVFSLFLVITVFPSPTLSKAIISMDESVIPQCSWGGAYPAS